LSDRHQRHVPLAAQLTGEDEKTVANKFLTQRILLTGDSARAAMPMGKVMLFTAANLIARFCPKIDLHIDGSTAAELLLFLERIDRSPVAEFRAVTRVQRDSYAAVLSVGDPPFSCPDAIRIDGVGWLAYLSIGTNPSAAIANEDSNPFGPLMSVALGVSEVFKYLLQPVREKASYLGNTSFSVFDFSVGGNNIGPSLPADIALPPTLLAGVGAVGNAFLLTLSNVRGVGGSIVTVDSQYLDDGSNLNRYSLAFEEEIDVARPMPKVDLARRLFAGTKVQILPFAEEIGAALQRIYRQDLPRPHAVLSAVDNNETREVLQKLWPNILIEGATDQTTSEVSRHEFNKGLACLMCIHRSRTSAASNAEPYEKLMSRLSGLSERRIGIAEKEGSAAISEEDVRAAPSDKSEYLAQRVGQPICSVLTEIERISTRPRDVLPVRPSVSFVSMTSGILLAAEYVKYAIGLKSALETFFQVDLMFPLENAFLQPVEKVDGCYCVERSKEILLYRKEVGP